jgi:citrate synthase
MLKTSNYSAIQWIRKSSLGELVLAIVCNSKKSYIKTSRNILRHRSGCIRPIMSQSNTEESFNLTWYPI